MTEPTRREPEMEPTDDATPYLDELTRRYPLDPNTHEALTAMYHTWRQPPADLLGKIRAHGTALDYLGHADTTRALLETDPAWTIEPAAIDPNTGGPKITNRDGNAVAWFYLTVCGVRRLCVGTCPDNKTEVDKELIGDAIRNGAMRFGVALALWSKADWINADTTPTADQAQDATEKPKPRRAANGPEANKAAAGKRTQVHERNTPPRIDGTDTEPADPALAELRQVVAADVERMVPATRGEFRKWVHAQGMPARSTDMDADQLRACRDAIANDTFRGEGGDHG